MGKGHRYHSAQGPESRIQNPGGVIEGKLEPWKGNGSRSGHRRRRWDVGPSGQEKQARQEANPNTRNVRLAGCPLSRIGITSRQQLRTVVGPGGPRKAPALYPSVSFQLSAGHRPGPDQPDHATAGHRTEGKAGRETAQHSLALPISNLTATRILETTPTANSVCTHLVL